MSSLSTPIPLVKRRALHSLSRTFTEIPGPIRLHLFVNGIPLLLSVHSGSQNFKWVGTLGREMYLQHSLVTTRKEKEKKGGWQVSNVQNEKGNVLMPFEMIKHYCRDGDKIFVTLERFQVMPFVPIVAEKLITKDKDFATFSEVWKELPRCYQSFWCKFAYMDASSFTVVKFVFDTNEVITSVETPRHFPETSVPLLTGNHVSWSCGIPMNKISSTKYELELKLPIESIICFCFFYLNQEHVSKNYPMFSHESDTISENNGGRRITNYLLLSENNLPKEKVYLHDISNNSVWPGFISEDPTYELFNSFVFVSQWSEESKSLMLKQDLSRIPIQKLALAFPEIMVSLEIVIRDNYDCLANIYHYYSSLDCNTSGFMSVKSFLQLLKSCFVLDATLTSELVQNLVPDLNKSMDLISLLRTPRDPRSSECIAAFQESIFAEKGDRPCLPNHVNDLSKSVSVPPIRANSLFDLSNSSTSPRGSRNTSFRSNDKSYKNSNVALEDTNEVRIRRKSNNYRQSFSSNKVTGSNRTSLVANRGGTLVSNSALIDALVQISDKSGKKLSTSSNVSDGKYTNPREGSHDVFRNYKQDLVVKMPLCRATMISLLIRLSCLKYPDAKASIAFFKLLKNFIYPNAKVFNSSVRQVLRSDQVQAVYSKYFQKLRRVFLWYITEVMESNDGNASKGISRHLSQAVANPKQNINNNSTISLRQFWKMCLTFKLITEKLDANLIVSCFCACHSIEESSRHSADSLTWSEFLEIWFRFAACSKGINEQNATAKLKDNPTVAGEMAANLDNFLSMLDWPDFTKSSFPLYNDSLTKNSSGTHKITRNSFTAIEKSFKGSEKPDFSRTSKSHHVTSVNSSVAAASKKLNSSVSLPNLSQESKLPRIFDSKPDLKTISRYTPSLLEALSKQSNYFPTSTISLKSSATMVNNYNFPASFVDDDSIVFSDPFNIHDEERDSMSVDI